jgi:hypothetical protein
MRNRLVPLMVLTMLMALSAAGAYIAWVGIQTRAIERELNALTDQNTPDVQQWRLVDARADALIERAPWDFDAHDLAGRVYLFGAESIATQTPKEGIQRLRKAKQALVRAAQLRPEWAYTQLNLARIEYALDVRGPWAAHLQAALVNGGRGQSLQLDLMQFRASLGDRLTGALKAQVEAAQARAIADHPWEMANLAARLNRLEWVCTNPADNLLSVCDNLRAR